MRKIKILYLIPQLLVGGTERHLCDLVTHLNRKKFEPVVWCTGQWGPIGDEMVKAGARVVRYPLSFYHLGDLVKASCFIKKEKFDIFHSYNSYGPHFIDAVIAKITGIPVYISTRRNMRHWKGGNKLHLAENIRNYLSDIVIANSEAVKRKTVEVEGMPPDRIKVIYNGVDINDANTRNMNHDLRERLNIPDDHVIVGNLANLKPIKGQKYLIQAFAKVLERAEKVKLIIAGEGSEKERLSNLVEKLRIRGDVTIANFENQRFDLLSLFDIFVLPSLSEGFPNVLIEAMATSKPIIATDVGGNREAVIHGKTGYLVPAGDFRRMANAIANLLSNKSLQVKFGHLGRKRVEKMFSLEKMVSKTEELYERLLKKKRIGKYA